MASQTWQTNADHPYNLYISIAKEGCSLAFDCQRPTCCSLSFLPSGASSSITSWLHPIVPRCSQFSFAFLHGFCQHGIARGTHAQAFEYVDREDADVLGCLGATSSRTGREDTDSGRVSELFEFDSFYREKSWSTMNYEELCAFNG